MHFASVLLHTERTYDSSSILSCNNTGELLECASLFGCLIGQVLDLSRIIGSKSSSKSLFPKFIGVVLSMHSLTVVLRVEVRKCIDEELSVSFDNVTADEMPESSQTRFRLEDKLLLFEE